MGEVLGLGAMTIGILSITLFCLVVGLLVGICKGLTRSLLHLISVVLSIVLALAFKEVVTNIVIKSVNVNGVNLQEYLLNMICKGDFEALKPNVEPIVKIMIGIAVFLVLVLALNVVLGIINTIICKIVLKDSKKGARLLGGLVGIAAGAVTAIVMCTCLSGLSKNIGSLAEAKMDGQPILEYAGVQEVYDETGIDEYNESKVSALYFKVPVIYDVITSTKIDGQKYTLDGQVQSIKVSLQLLDALNRLSQVDFTNGLNDSNVKASTDILKDLGDLTQDLPEEVVNTINGIIVNAAASIGDGIDLSGVDLGNIDFVETANLFDIAYEIDAQTTPVTTEQVERLIDSAVKSGAVDLLDQTSVAFNLDDDDKATISKQIDKNVELSEADKAALKSIL